MSIHWLGSPMYSNASYLDGPSGTNWTRCCHGNGRRPKLRKPTTPHSACVRSFAKHSICRATGTEHAKVQVDPPFCILPPEDHTPPEPSNVEGVQRLRSSPITEPSSLLQTTPSLCPASVLWSSRISPLGRLPLHRDDRFSRSIQEPDLASRRLNAGCRAGNFQVCSRACPGGSDHARFRHRLGRFDTSSMVRSRAPLQIILPKSSPGFSATLTTIAFDDRSLQRFEACT